MSDNASGRWTAIILAGQRPGENDFAHGLGHAAKALIEVGGEAMLARVARTLLASPEIARIVILAQQPHELVTGGLAWIAAEPRIVCAVGEEGISRGILALAGSDTAPWPVLVVTADHPLLTPEMVASFLAEAGSTDASVAIVARDVVEAAYPETRRTWLRFKGGDYTGANLFALRTPSARKALEIWSQIEHDRKKVGRLLHFFGPMLALRALTRTISLDNALSTAARRAGLSVRAVRMPFAEAAIDVDKLDDLRLVERIVAGR